MMTQGWIRLSGDAHSRTITVGSATCADNKNWRSAWNAAPTGVRSFESGGLENASGNWPNLNPLPTRTNRRSEWKRPTFRSSMQVDRQIRCGAKTFEFQIDATHWPSLPEVRRRIGQIWIRSGRIRIRADDYTFLTFVKTTL